MKRQRPLMPGVVPWQSPGPSGGHTSYGAIVRKRHRVWLYCDRCVPPWSMDAINLNDWPWRRYLNYPTEADFYCPACRRPMKMHVMPYDVPGTGAAAPMSATASASPRPQTRRPDDGDCAC